jgi:hypothetical protein
LRSSSLKGLMIASIFFISESSRGGRAATRVPSGP